MQSTNNVGAGQKRSRSVGPTSTLPRVQRDDESKKSSESMQKGATKSSQHTAQLSGATRNMRFMQRNTSTRHSYPPAASQPNKRGNDHMIVVKVQDDSKSETNVDSTIQKQEPLSNANDASSLNCNNNDNRVDQATVSTSSSSSVRDHQFERITTSFDMYYGGNLLIGRRSYNGFNPITASNYYLHQKAIDYDLQEKGSNKKKKKSSIMNVEEQQRVEELSNELRKDNSRNERHSSSGRKNGGGKGMISNHKKKDLDDILKFVNS